jgi:hypothetical protein
MEPLFVVILVVVVGLVAAVLVNRWVRGRTVALSDYFDDFEPAADPGAGPGGEHVRRGRALEREAEATPPPADPAVAELAARIRDRYRVGKDSWDNNTAGVRRDLEGETGLKVAVLVLERAVADFRWELDFWAKEAGLAAAGPGMPAKERFARLRGRDHPNPFNTPSGYHPRIHLIAAAEALTVSPRAEVAGPLADLLELWFAHAERQESIRDVDIKVLETLVRCYRATPVAEHPAFLTSLAAGEVVSQVVNMENVVSRVEDGITYLDPVFHDDGSYGLSALARAATTR